MVLFGVVLLGTGGVLGAVARGSAYSQTQTTASFFLQHRAERLRRMGFDALADGAADTTLAAGTVLRTEWDVTDVVPGRLVRVDMRVWRIPAGRGGAPRGVRFFIANRDP